MRAIAIGENQFELYASLREAAGSMELPEVKSGLHAIYDEAGQGYEFEICNDDDVPVGTLRLKAVQSGGLEELISKYRQWVS